MDPHLSASHIWLEHVTAGPSAGQWKKIGHRRRAGICLPLFSIHSRQSLGIGELPDLEPVVDWCSACGFSILQLLPLNDVGSTFRPYDAESSFALDPVYLRLTKLTGVDAGIFAAELQELRSRFPAGQPLVNYGIKSAKLELLRALFDSRSWEGVAAFGQYQTENRFWLEDFACFKVIKQMQADQAWENWPEPLRAARSPEVAALAREQAEEILFQKWLQWQLAEQFAGVKRYAAERQVLILGDLPLLVARDSADTWSHPEYFKMHLASGAPPDAYLSKGQRWGMPPFDWDRIAGDGYAYWREKLKYAERFYDLYRVDHFVGLFRLWTIPLAVPLDEGGLIGAFDPPEESAWEDHGRRILDVMLGATAMLPCAEDLGVIPACSFKVLHEYGLVGMDIQRWSRDWDRTYRFTPPAGYRINTIATLSTHDMTFLRGWWEYEAGTVDEWLFRRKCGERGWDAEEKIRALFDLERSRHGRLYWKREVDSEQKLSEILGKPVWEIRDLTGLYAASFREQEQFWTDMGLGGPWEAAFSRRLAEAALEHIHTSNALFSIQLLPDWLGLGPYFDALDPWEYRVNFPGSVRPENWSRTLPFPVERLSTFPENDLIRRILERSGRT